MRFPLWGVSLWTRLTFCTALCQSVQSLLWRVVVSGEKKKKKKIHLSAPWPLTPAPDSAAAPWASGPLRGGLECVQVRGFGLSWRLEESFPGQTGFPLRSFSPSRSHSFIRSFSLGPDSNQRLLEDTKDILLQQCGTNAAGNLNCFPPLLPCCCCCVDTSWSKSGLVEPSGESYLAETIQKIWAVRKFFLAPNQLLLIWNNIMRLK